MKKKMLICMITVLCLYGSANAVLITDVHGTYYDATTSNTAASDGTTPWYTTTSQGINKWNYNSASTTAIGGTVFEGYSPSGNVYQLTTTIAGLDSGKTYDVYVVYHARTGGSWNWHTMAALSGTTMIDCAYNNAEYVLATGTLVSCEKLIGRISGVKSFAVDVDAPQPSSSYIRAWYDGVAIVEVPEPATLVILGIGSALAFFRRKK
jgi:hypothetical protein